MNERFLTDIARVRSFSGVCLQVCVQRANLSKRLATLITNVWFLSGVNDLVNFQICESSENLAANVAHERFTRIRRCGSMTSIQIRQFWPFIEMYAHMFVQSAKLWERSMTLPADERFQFVVNALVFLQSGQTSESFLAFVAFVLVTFGVNQFVISQHGELTEIFATVDASERFLLCM